MKMPDGLEYWTLDEVAECLSVGKNLYRKLWGLLDECENITPEYPDARLGTTEDDKIKQWWNKLTQDEQKEICDAWEKEEATKYV
jgi:hypothetical protein